MSLTEFRTVPDVILALTLMFAITSYDIMIEMRTLCPIGDIMGLNIVRKPAAEPTGVAPLPPPPFTILGLRLCSYVRRLKRRSLFP